MPTDLSAINWSWGAWGLGAAVAAILSDRLGLWLTLRYVSLKSLAHHRRLAGGVNRFHVHGLNTAENCKTPMSIS